MAKENTQDRKRLWLIVTAVVVAVVLLAAFMSLRRSDVLVRVEPAVRGTISSAISTNGKIEPIDDFEAHAPAPTTVRNVFVKDGDHVNAGQLLVQLDDVGARAQAAKAEAQVKAAEAELAAVKAGGTREEVFTNESQIVKAQTELETARRNLEALQRLQQKGAASPEEVQAAQNRANAAQADLNVLNQKRTARFSSQDVARAQSQVSEARAALAAAQELVREIDIHAPREGMVYNVPVHEGQFLATGDLIVAVANLSTVQVRAFVDEPDIGRLHRGQTVLVTWDAIPGRTWQGTLTRLPTTVATLGSRNIGQITCTVNNEDRKLLPNVNVSVTVVTAQDENAISVPREAIHQDASGRFVYQVVDGHLKRTPVQTSVSNLTRIAVSKGLSDNAVVALGTVNSQQQLRDGLPVRLVSK